MFTGGVGMPNYDYTEPDLRDKIVNSRIGYHLTIIRFVTNGLPGEIFHIHLPFGIITYARDW